MWSIEGIKPSTIWIKHNWADAAVTWFPRIPLCIIRPTVGSNVRVEKCTPIVCDETIGTSTPLRFDI
jgi:hypothetical protein